jgi:hypothetical protein
LLEINKTAQEVILGYLADTFTDPRATIQIIGDFNINTTLDVNLYQSPNHYILNTDSDGLQFLKCCISKSV